MSLKSQLKTARQQIDAKDYESARETCLNVLSEDPQNYTACVFAAVCAQNMGHVDESEMYYKRAIEINPDTLLAYQVCDELYLRKGLVALHEKTQIKSSLANALANFRNLYVIMYYILFSLLIRKE
jgi:superkiller protein 3